MRILFLILCVCVYGLEAGATKPQSSEKNHKEVVSRQKSIQPEGTQQTIATYYQTGQPNPNAKEQQYDPRSDRLYRAYLLATVIGVLGGIAGIIILIVQTIATKRAANAAKASADTLKAIERPWLLISSYMLVSNQPEVIDGVQETRMAVYWHFKNFGKTPAFFDGVEGGIDIANPSDAFKPVYKPPLIAVEDNVFAQEKESGPLMFTMRKLENSEWKQIKEGQLALVFFGVIKYRDAFRGSDCGHLTKFSYRYTAEPNPGFYVTFGPKEYNEYT